MAKPTHILPRPALRSALWLLPWATLVHAAPEARPAGKESPAIQVHRTAADRAARLDRAYDGLLAGRLDTARQDYEQAWRDDPKSVDALLGLATIARSQRRQSDADRYYRLALEADPTNTTALAALLGTGSQADPALAESQIKTLLAAQPQAAPLHFALGNLHARQGRWRDAQQSYFNALSGDADNPDYLFNLAVSLDRLRQPNLALRHYRLALEAGDRRTPAFDRDEARRRLRELQP